MLRVSRGYGAAVNEYIGRRLLRHEVEEMARAGGGEVRFYNSSFSQGLSGVYTEDPLSLPSLSPDSQKRRIWRKGGQK